MGTTGTTKGKKPRKAAGAAPGGALEIITHAPGEAASEKVVDLSEARARLSPESVPQERAKRIAAAVAEFNQTHALARVKGRAYILTEEPNEIGHPSYVLMQTSDFGLFYRNAFVRLPKVDSRGNLTWENKRKGDLWLDSPQRRSVTALTFKPGGDVAPHEYNVFKGWGVVPTTFDPQDPERGCARILELTRLLFGAQGEAPYKWAMRWLAQLVQNPEDKPGTALVLRSGEGTGKGTFMNVILKPILRSAFVHITNRKHLVGNFNSIWQGSLLVFVDEAVWAGDKEGEGVLKALITEPTVTIEYKGKDAFSMPNLARLIFASNNDWVVPAGATARRFGVYDVDESRAQDAAFFDGVRKEAANGGLEAFFSYLLAYDVGDERELRTPILTDSLIAQKVATLRTDSVAHWWFERLYDGELSGAVDSLANGVWPKEITRERVRASYETYCKRMNVRHPASAEEIGRRLVHEFGVGSARAKTVREGVRPMLYTFDAPGAEESSDPDYARIAHFRAVFEQRQFGGGYAWPGMPEPGEDRDCDVLHEDDQIPH